MVNKVKGKFLKNPIIKSLILTMGGHFEMLCHLCCRHIVEVSGFLLFCLPTAMDRSPVLSYDNSLLSCRILEQWLMASDQRSTSV